jgi:carboxyl-terminal processing protease
MQNKRKINIYLPIILAIVLVAGMILGLNLNKVDPDDRVFIYPRSNNKITNVINYVVDEYVDSVSRKNLVETAIPEMLKTLDPHSVYIPAEELKRVNEPLQGNFEGIGIQFNMPNDTVIVINTISGGPSEKVGIQPGDRIIKIEDTLVAGKDIPTTQIVRKLKGPKGTKVSVSIQRKGVDELLEFGITRDEIPLYSVDVSYMIEDSLGYIKISRFARTTHQEFVKAVHGLQEEGLRQLIVDLRGNGGGYMDAATDIANEFLPDGKLIVYTEGKASPRNEIYSNAKGNCLDCKVNILIDEWSASASEILAGAIQDNDRGLIIGRRSFGKGLVQQQTVFPDGSALRLTVARYYTPTGRCIQKPYDNGNESYYADLSDRYDRGEFKEEDSIHFADSLAYTTPGGDTVYGGGGIMPDVFIPIDTSGYTEYYRRLVNKGLIYKFAFEYADMHREELSAFADHEEISQYLEQHNAFNEFLAYSRDQGIETNWKQLKISRELLHTQLKAYIARNIIDNEGFYPILMKVDNTLQEAVKWMKKN